MKIHIVQKGDTLWEIAKKYHVDFEELKQLNSHLASPDMIMPGMKIRIPTQSKKITQGNKAQVSPETVQKSAPAPKQQMQPTPTTPMQQVQPSMPAPKQQPKTQYKETVELPKMPTFPLAQGKTLPTLDEKYKEYPTAILPELPAAPKQQVKQQTQQPKQQTKQKVQPKPKVAPKIEMPKEQAPAMQAPVFMLPMEFPCYPPAQMMPVFSYPCPCPCPGYMPMPMPVEPKDCGCGGGQMQSNPYFPNAMQPGMFPMQAPMYQGGMQYGQPFASPGHMNQPMNFNMDQGNIQQSPQMMQQHSMDQYMTAGNTSPSMQPQMFQATNMSNMQMAPQAFQQPTENGNPYEENFLQMYPEPYAGMRDDEKELSPSPIQTETQEKDDEREE